MHSRTLDFQLVIFSGLIISLVIGLTIGLGLILSGLSSMSALAEPVPFNCMILPGQEVASILMTNSLPSDASCIVTCKAAEIDRGARGVQQIAAKRETIEIRAKARYLQKKPGTCRAF